MSYRYFSIVAGTLTHQVAWGKGKGFFLDEPTRRDGSPARSSDVGTRSYQGAFWMSSKSPQVWATAAAAGLVLGDGLAHLLAKRPG